MYCKVDAQANRSACGKHGVRFELGVVATFADVIAVEPQRVVLATGASMTWPYGLPTHWRDDGVLLDARTLADSLIAYKRLQGGTAVLFDMDHTEGTYAFAQVLARLFDRTIIITPRERIAADVPLVSILGIYRRLTQQGVQLMPLSELSLDGSLEDGRIAYRNIHTGEKYVIDNVGLAGYSTPRAPRDELLAPLIAAGLPVVSVGDCRWPRTLLAATSEGHAAGFGV